MSFITIVPVFRCLCANRIFTNHCRLKIFVPITVLAFVVLVPVNWTNDTLEGMTLVHSYIDKLSISNIPTGSKRWATDRTLLIFLRLCTYLQRQRPGRKFNIFHVLYRFIAHLAMAYAITFWTCYVLRREYQIIANMRLRFLASEKRRPDQFTVWSFNSAALFLFSRFGSICLLLHITLNNWTSRYTL